MNKSLGMIVAVAALCFFMNSAMAAEAAPPTIVFMNFDGDPNFPSLTILRDTTSLAPFTGSALRLSPGERDELVRGVVHAAREDFRDFNIRFVTDPALLSGDYYTWGIDDSAYVWRMLDEDDISPTFEEVFIQRLYGKAGYNPIVDNHLGLKFARTWSGSFALVPDVDMRALAIVDRDDWPEIIDQPIFQIVHPPYSGPSIQQVVIDIPTYPFSVPQSWEGTLAQPVTWMPSSPPLIQYKDCTLEERHPHTGWGCGIGIRLENIIQALANNAAHEISHLFGSQHHGDPDRAGNKVNAFTDDCPPLMMGGCIGHLLVSQSEYIEANYDKAFGPDNHQILMDELGAAPPENPELSSSTHGKGQPSCDQALTTEWEKPYAVRGVGGYSYTIVSQDDPFYNENRAPDDTVDFDSSVTSFTTSLLEPGHIWEFNIRTIDADGVAGRFYSSFWVEIESCAVEITYPRADLVFQVGDWEQVIWNPVKWDGNDVSSGYDVESIDLYKGNDSVKNLWSNYPNLDSMPWLVPSVDSGSNYRIGIVLSRNATGDKYPEYPESLIGYSDYFSIGELPPPIMGDVDGDGDIDRNDVNLIMSARNTPATGPDDPRDLDGDGVITANDARQAVLLCTNPRCAP